MSGCGARGASAQGPNNMPFGLAKHCAWGDVPATSTIDEIPRPGRVGEAAERPLCRMPGAAGHGFADHDYLTSPEPPEPGRGMGTEATPFTEMPRGVGPLRGGPAATPRASLRDALAAREIAPVDPALIPCLCFLSSPAPCSVDARVRGIARARTGNPIR